MLGTVGNVASCKLVHGGLLLVRAEGRRRLSRLASSEVAYAIETLASIAPVARIASLSQHNTMSRLREARFVELKVLGPAIASTFAAAIPVRKAPNNSRFYRMQSRSSMQMAVRVTSSTEPIASQIKKAPTYCARSRSTRRRLEIRRCKTLVERVSNALRKANDSHDPKRRTQISNVPACIFINTAVEGSDRDDVQPSPSGVRRVSGRSAE